MTLPPCRHATDKCGGECTNTPSVSQTSSSDVYFEGILSVRQTDVFTPHPATDPHTGRKVASGSSTVYVNGLQVARISDPIDCGAFVAEGASTVFIGG